MVLRKVMAVFEVNGTCRQRENKTKHDKNFKNIFWFYIVTEILLSLGH